jgi:hypothetical protein
LDIASQAGYDMPFSFETMYNLSMLKGSGDSLEYEIKCESDGTLVWFDNDEGLDDSFNEQDSPQPELELLAQYKERLQTLMDQLVELSEGKRLYLKGEVFFRAPPSYIEDHFSMRGDLYAGLILELAYNYFEKKFQGDDQRSLISFSEQIKLAIKNIQDD